MAAQHKRVWKLQEFVAHGSNVSCLSVGPSSARVMVTGGEDRKVNMWAVGKPNVILTLSGHTSPVEYVKFNSGEDLVIAGSQSGTLKIWDLEAAKIVRTLTGHKSSIRGIDFHPYGEFVASGSLDTNVKLWDVRRKGCIVTFKGHTDGINFVRFSPDGRWIVSASDDHTVKLWDLISGKLLHDFKQHTAASTCVEFHPKEFLLATASNDRTVKFWDLETFQLVSSIDPETNGIRCIAFHPEGLALFSGAQDSMRVYGWEPVRCYDSFSLSWGKVADMAISSSQLIGASFLQTNVSVWVVDLGHLENMIAKYADESHDVKNDVVAKKMTSIASIIPPSVTVKVYKNGNSTFLGKNLVINRRCTKTMEALYDQITTHISAFNAVRKICTPIGGRPVQNLESIKNKCVYVAAGREEFKKLNYADLGVSKQRSPRKTKNTLRRAIIVAEGRHKMDYEWGKRDLKILYVFCNGDVFKSKVKVVLQKRFQQNMEQILSIVQEHVTMAAAIAALYTMDGKLISFPSELVTGSDYVAVERGRAFKRMNYGGGISPWSKSPRVRVLPHIGNGQLTNTGQFLKRKRRKSQITSTVGNVFNATGLMKEKANEVGETRQAKDEKLMDLIPTEDIIEEVLDLRENVEEDQGSKSQLQA